LSALRTGHLLPPGNTPGTHFCYRLSRPQGHSATGRIMSLKNSNDTIGNRTRDLPACSAVQACCFYENIRTIFCGHNILTDGVFVTQLSGNAGISLSQIVWVKTNFCFMSNMLWPGGYNACFVPGGPRMKYRSRNCLSCLRFLLSYSAP
jgi:hypothetical protein